MANVLELRKGTIAGAQFLYLFSNKLQIYVHKFEIYEEYATLRKNIHLNGRKVTFSSDQLKSIFRQSDIVEAGALPEEKD